MRSALRRGVELARFRNRLGRMPTPDELAVEFEVGRATAYRYLHVLRGTPPCSGHSSMPPHQSCQRRAPGAEHVLPDLEVGKVMREFGLPPDQAAAVLAYDRGDDFPAFTRTRREKTA